jgi:uncharacterized metal-binding protein
MIFNPFSGELTDNFKANILLLPLSIIIYWRMISGFYSSAEVSFDLLFFINFILIYVYASRFFQPDLDHKTHRPGMSHFPFGKNISVFLMGMHGPLRVFSIIQQVCAKVWYWYWKPFTFFVTHRGLTHLPIIGTISRTLYLYLGAKAVISLHLLGCHLLLGFSHHLNIWMVSVVVDGLNSIPLERVMTPVMDYIKQTAYMNGHTKGFLLYSSPIYIADIIHQSVDMYDSVRRGKRYCSTPPHDWGVIKRIFPRLPRKF